MKWRRITNTHIRNRIGRTTTEETSMQDEQEASQNVMKKKKKKNSRRNKYTIRNNNDSLMLNYCAAFIVDVLNIDHLLMHWSEP